MDSRAYMAAVCQFTPSYINRSESVERICAQVENAVSEVKDTKLVVFPETATVGMPGNLGSHDQHWRLEPYLEAAEPADGPTAAALGKLARSLGVHVVTGFVEADPRLAGIVYNSAMLVDSDGEIAAVHRKVQSGGIYANGRVVSVVPTELGTLGLSICYDLWFPEFARIQAREGCEIHVNSTANQPIFAVGSTHVPVVRAAENGMFVLSANLVGDQRDVGGRQYVGYSSIVSPSGAVIGMAGDRKEETVFGLIDRRLIVSARALVAPLKDIRTDVYDVVYHGPPVAAGRRDRDEDGAADDRKK
jgi:5-aminopentanamidase